MDFYSVSKEIEWDMGHRVPNHKSKCSNPHGHRYKLRTHVRGPVVTDMGASDEGMVADFGDIKALMNELVHDVLDHGFMVSSGDYAMLEALFGYTPKPELAKHPVWNVVVVDFIPTAENMARWCFDRLCDPVAELNGGLRLEQVQLWETPTSVATYPS